MRYAAIIIAKKSSSSLLEDIAPSFVSSIATIRKLKDNRWILESSTFKQYESVDKLYEAANKLLSNIHSVLALYLGRFDEPLSVSAIVKLNDNDEVISAQFHASLQIVVTPRAADVLNPTASGSVGTAVLSAADVNGAVQEALSLVGRAAPTWGQVYNIIEFLGMDLIVKFGFARRSEVVRVRQTANHHRHLGNSKKNPLPPNPPTLDEAYKFAFELLKKWIAGRI